MHTSEVNTLRDAVNGIAQRWAEGWKFMSSSGVYALALSNVAGKIVVTTAR